MTLNELSELIIQASITLYDITESDTTLTAELNDSRIIKVEIMGVNNSVNNLE